MKVSKSFQSSYRLNPVPGSMPAFFQKSAVLIPLSSADLEALKGAREEADSCKTTVGELRDQLTLKKSDITRLEANLLTCAKDKERLSGVVVEGDDSKGETCDR